MSLNKLVSEEWYDISGHDDILEYTKMTGSPFHYVGDDMWIAPGCGEFVSENYGCECKKCKKVLKALENFI